MYHKCLLDCTLLCPSAVFESARYLLTFASEPESPITLVYLVSSMCVYCLMLDWIISTYVPMLGIRRKIRNAQA
jgi:hypothetical protein